MATHRPMPAYHFSVEWGGNSMGFSEISGLCIEVTPIEYREGTSPENKKIRMPGLEKMSTITLKRGIKSGDQDFFQWINTIRMGTVERRDLVVHLLDENHAPVMTWKVHNAWPSKVEVATLNAQASEVAVESIELVHEGLEII